MGQYGRNQVAIGTAISLLVLAIFIALQESNPESLHRMAQEDEPIETSTAILYGLSSICFLVFACRSDFLKERSRLCYFMTIGWALLMFIFMGEEISWGQRIFDIATPDALREINRQHEINIHNMQFMYTFLGGKHRLLIIMILTTGLLLPVIALSEFGKRAIQRFAFPVSPLCYAPLFVGAYVYPRYYYPIMGNDAVEVREFMMSVGMFSFSVTGAIYPCTLFRVCMSKA